MSDTKILALRLEGGMTQSWGETSKFDDRSTALMPTKSGIVGLIGNAMGLERGDPALVELNDSITLGVRADCSGLGHVDFHTITGRPLMTASGKPRGKNASTIISHCGYLCQACFIAFIQTSAELHDIIATALEHPARFCYLGRKNCLPAYPLLDAADLPYESLMDAIQHYKAREWPRYPHRVQYPMPFEIEVPYDNLSSYVRQDRVAGPREFLPRRVWTGFITPEGG